MSPSAVPLATYRACGKLILLGEHFVVHGSPALALPLRSLGTTVEVLADPEQAPARLESALDPGHRRLAELLLQAALGELELEGRGLLIRVSSSIPIGHGLGSSAAFSVALLGALARSSGHPLASEALHAKAHALERHAHGQPSGIDDTVVTLERPLWFRRGQPPRLLASPPGLSLLLGSSGGPGSTREAVSRVSELREREPARFEVLCDRARQVAERALLAFGEGQLPALGECLDETHGLLQELEVSTPQLDRLVEAARRAGALGAKLTGSGLGGFVLALARPGEEERLGAALAAAGAERLLRAGG